jgi:hypothetical protein
MMLLLFQKSNTGQFELNQLDDFWVLNDEIIFQILISSLSEIIAFLQDIVDHFVIESGF